MRWLRRMAYPWALFPLALWGAEVVLAPHSLAVGVLTALPHSPLLAPGLFFLVLALWKREQRLALVLLSSELFVLFVLAGFQVPLVTGAPGPVLRVVTLNLAGTPYGPDIIRTTLERTGADIIALQEIQVWNEKVRRALPHHPDWHLTQDGEFALYSRYPVETSELVELAPPGDSRPALLTRLSISGQTLQVVVVHYYTPFHGLQALKRPDLAEHLRRRRASREHATRKLLNLVDTGPTILCGDFNSRSSDPVMEPLWNRFQDSWQAGLGFGYTYDADTPLIRIDYVLASRHFKPVAAMVLPDRVSDHRGLVADLMPAPVPLAMVWGNQ